VDSGVETPTLLVTTIKAPTTNGGAIYGVGSNGQVLKSNGTTVYWGTDNSGSGSDKKTSSSYKSNTELKLVGAITPSTEGVETFTNPNCYIGTDNCIYSNGKKVATEE